MNGLNDNQVVDYDIFYSDESTSKRFLASNNYFEDVSKTKYSVISLSGDCKDIGINVKADNVEIKRSYFK